MRCDGMDILDTHGVVAEAVRRVREDRRPLLIEAITYRFRGHSMADPEQYRTKEEVAQWRARDPIPAFGELLKAEGVIDEDERIRIDTQAVERVDAAVAFADACPFPAPESLYDDVYVLDDAVRGSYSVRTTRPEEAADQGAEAQASGADGLREDGTEEISQQITTALQAGEDGS
jgi:pyruvate dehydrogenase E1 component alpha subunit